MTKIEPGDTVEVSIEGVTETKTVESIEWSTHPRYSSYYRLSFEDGTSVGMSENVWNEMAEDDEPTGLMDAMNESDAGCPECGGELVHEMGSEAKRCPACGWVEGEE